MTPNNKGLKQCALEIEFSSTDHIGKYYFNNVKTYTITGLFRSEGDDEYWCKTMLLRLEDVKSSLEIIDDISDLDEEELLDCAIEIVGWYGSGDNGSRPGCKFSNYPCAKFEGKSRKWIRVIQTGGLDI